MNGYTDRLFEGTGVYAQNILGALAVLVIGLLIAWLIAAVTRRLLRHTTLDERIARAVRGERDAKGIDTARWLSRGVFWVLVLVTLLGFFQALGFTPITRPLERAFDVAIGFLPRLLAAVALGVVAWIVASFLRLVVGRGLDALHIDERIARRTRRTPDGAAATTEGAAATTTRTATYETPQAGARISRGLAQAVYWLVWLLFLPAILGALALRGILGPVQGMVDRILAFLPNVLTAGLIILVAYFVGRIVAGLVTSLLSAVGFDRLMERVGLTRAATRVGETLETGAPRFVPSRVAGTLTLVVIVLFAAMEAFDVIAFEQLSEMLYEVLVLLGRIALGLIIFAVGWGLANLAGQAIRSSGVQNAGVFASVARVAILVLAGAMALRQMGFANEIINLAFGLLLGGLAIAVAVAFGVGGRHVAGRELDRWVSSLRQRPAAANGERAPAPR